MKISHGLTRVLQDWIARPETSQRTTALRTETIRWALRHE